jgi:hypothetical protein
MASRPPDSDHEETGDAQQHILHILHASNSLLNTGALTVHSYQTNQIWRRYGPMKPFIDY